MSATTQRQHSFKPHHFASPTWCDMCKKFIWGLGKQGLKCKQCDLVIHKTKCIEHVPKVCSGLAIPEARSSTNTLVSSDGLLQNAGGSGSRKTALTIGISSSPLPAIVSRDGSTLQRKLTPASHTFAPYHFNKPTWCALCAKFIWGVSGKQGYRCTQCKMAIHKMGRCMDLLLTDPRKGSCTKGECDEDEYEEDDSSLPVTVMFHIFSFLTTKEIANVALLSCYYYSVVIEWRTCNQISPNLDHPATPPPLGGASSLSAPLLLGTPSSSSLRKKRGTRNIQRMLVVTIAEAKDLSLKASNELSDPYVSIRLDHHQRRKTKVIHGTIFPVWQETFTYLLAGESHLRVTVWDWNLLVKKKYLGSVSIPLDEFKSKDMSKEAWYKLGPKSVPGKSRTTVSNITGEIKVVIESKPFALTENTTFANDEEVSLEKVFRDRRMRILEMPVTGASLSRRRLYGANFQKYGSNLSSVLGSNVDRSKESPDLGPMRKTIVQSALSFGKTTRVSSIVAAAELNVDDNIEDASPPISSNLLTADSTTSSLSTPTQNSTYAIHSRPAPTLGNLPMLQIYSTTNMTYGEYEPPSGERLYADSGSNLYGTANSAYGASNSAYGATAANSAYGTSTSNLYGTANSAYGTANTNYGSAYSVDDNKPPTPGSTSTSPAPSPGSTPATANHASPSTTTPTFFHTHSGSDDKDELTSNLGDWNFRYQRIMLLLRKLSEHNASLQAEIEVRRSLVQLSQDFLYTAKAYGKIIISEVYLPVKQKTIKPVDVGGIAGGEKYIIHNILFKFAVDDKGVYGGNDAAAAKAAGHDLKGLQSYVNCDIPGICTPFMVLVDYRGFRLIAMSILPIEKSTLIYGSANAGTTVYNEDIKVDRMMRLASKILNLKPHVIQGKTMHSAVDLEGHRGKDGCFYLVDFSRVLPPENPRKEIRNAKLFRLLRPEFVRAYSKPLCSDAFSPATRTEKEHNEEVVAATEYLFTTTIPRFAKELCVIFEEGKDSQVRIAEALHSRGINLRYLGLILKAVETDLIPHPNLSILLVIEMVARAIKINLRTRLREKMKELRIPVEEPYRRLVIGYLNLVFGNTQQSDLYWNNSIRSDVKQYFTDFMLKEEDEFNFSLKKLVTSFQSPITKQSGKEILFGRVRKLSGLKFSSFFEKELLENPDKLNEEKPFDELDLDEIGERIKHMNTVQQAEGYMLLIKGIVHRATNSTAAKRSFNLAIEKFQEALDSNSNSKVILRDCAQTMVYLYKEIAADKSANADRTLLKQAHTYYARSIEIDSSDSKSLMKYARFIEEFHTNNSTPSTPDLSVHEASRELSANLNLAEEYYLQALENDPDYRDCLIAYGQFLDAKRNDPESAEKFYLRARAAFVLEEQRQNDLTLSKVQEKTKKKYQMKVYRK